MNPTDLGWIVCLGLSGLVTAKVAYQTFAQRKCLAAVLEWLGGGTASLIACWLATNDVARSGGGDETPGLISKFESLGYIVVAAALTCLFLESARRLVAARQELARGWVALNLLGCVVLTIWCHARVHEAFQPPVDELVLSNANEPVNQRSDVVLRTDVGRELALFEWGGDLAAVENTHPDLLKPTHSTIQRSEPDPTANCHGWVFADGQFLLLGHSVDHLLEDNHYWRVDEPSAGDVIIYRDELGEIVHSGIVRGLLNDGTVVVESKFGIGGRYLHLPEDQPYSTHFDFYRSSRAQSVANVTAPTSPELADCVADDCVRCELHAKIQAAPSPPATKDRLATGAE